MPIIFVRFYFINTVVNKWILIIPFYIAEYFVIKILNRDWSLQMKEMHKQDTERGTIKVRLYEV